jgi:hypothetical protein
MFIAVRVPLTFVTVVPIGTLMSGWMPTFEVR